MDNIKNEIIAEIHQEIDDIFLGWYENFEPVLFGSMHISRFKSMEIIAESYANCVKKIDSTENFESFTKELIICFGIYMSVFIKTYDQRWRNFIKLIDTLDFSKKSTFDYMMEEMYTLQNTECNKLFVNRCIEAYENMKEMNVDLSVYREVFIKAFNDFSIENKIALYFNDKKFEKKRLIFELYLKQTLHQLLLLQ